MKELHHILKPPDSYHEQLASPEWGTRRRQFIRKYGAYCRSCRRQDVRLEVHHINYTFGKHLADYEDEDLTVLCTACHSEWTKTMRAFRRLLSFWPVSDIKSLFGILSIAAKKHGSSWPAMKLMHALEAAPWVKT